MVVKKIEKEVNYTLAVMDPGYGNFKIGKADPVKEIYLGTIQPSVISRVPQWEYEKLSGIGQSACIDWKGEKYLVGTLALTYGLSIPSLSQNWLTDLACPLFALSFCRGVEELYVMISPSDWELKSKIETSLKEAGFNNVKFAVQGTGIWLEAGSPRNAIVIDVGFNTVDVLMINNGTVIRELCFALRECGLVSFLEKLTKDDPMLLARRLEEGDQELAEKVKNYYYPWLFEKLEARTEWRKRPHQMKLIIGGGGAYFVPDDLRKKVTIPRHPELANVKGFTFFLMKKKKEELNRNENKSSTVVA